MALPKFTGQKLKPARQMSKKLPSKMDLPHMKTKPLMGGPKPHSKLASAGPRPHAKAKLGSIGPRSSAARGSRGAKMS